MAILESDIQLPKSPHVSVSYSPSQAVPSLNPPSHINSTVASPESVIRLNLSRMEILQLIQLIFQKISKTD